MKQSKRGSILVFALIITFFLMVVAIGMATVAVTQFKSSASTAKTIKAFQYADTGAENVLVLLKKSEYHSAQLYDSTASGGLDADCEGGNPTHFAYKGELYGTERYKVIFMDESRNRLHCNDSVRAIKYIKSTGSYLNNTRAVEVTVPCSSPYGPETNVVGLWHLQETTGVGAWLLDSSGNDNHGTPNPIDLSTVDGICNAKNFDGDRDYITMESDLGSGPYTIEFWFKADRVDGGVLMHMASTSTGGDPGWCLPIIGFTAGGNLSVQSWNGGSVVATSPDVTPRNRWIHVAKTWGLPTDDYPGLRLYVNGETKGNTPMANYTGSGASNYIFPGNSFSGKTCTSGAIIKRDFDGVIDEIRTFNRARTESQIRDDFCTGCHMLDPLPDDCPC